MYVDENYYRNTYGGKVEFGEIKPYLVSAAHHIDTLTFNRIKGLGFGSLTPFQQGAIKEANCMLAEFERENEDVLKSVLSSYSINGVAMSFGESWNITIRDGVAISKDIYGLIKQTGLARQVI